MQICASFLSEFFNNPKLLLLPFFKGGCSPSQTFFAWESALGLRGAGAFLPRCSWHGIHLTCNIARVCLLHVRCFGGILQVRYFSQICRLILGITLHSLRKYNPLCYYSAFSPYCDELLFIENKTHRHSSQQLIFLNSKPSHDDNPYLHTAYPVEERSWLSKSR